MSDEEQGGGAPGGWRPTPGGDYDADATAFVKLPEHLTGDDEIPLAAPGHGYVPPRITVAPVSADAADPAATGNWPLPGAPQQAEQQAPGQDGWQGRTPPRPEDGYGYETQTGWYTPPGAEQGGPQAGAGQGAGSDVTGQWSVPVARGDLPDESGEFSASALASQWGAAPPATLPGGAPAPWAAPADGGQDWEGAGRGAAPGQGQEPPGGAQQGDEQPLVRPYARLRPQAPGPNPSTANPPGQNAPGHNPPGHTPPPVDSVPGAQDPAGQDPTAQDPYGARRPAPPYPAPGAPQPRPAGSAPGERGPYPAPDAPPAARAAAAPPAAFPAAPPEHGGQRTGGPGAEPDAGPGGAAAPYGTGPAQEPYPYESYPRRDEPRGAAEPGPFAHPGAGARAPHPQEPPGRSAPPAHAGADLPGAPADEPGPSAPPHDGPPHDGTPQADPAPRDHEPPVRPAAEDTATAAPRIPPPAAQDGAAEGPAATVPEDPAAPEDPAQESDPVPEAHALAESPDPGAATEPGLPYDEHPLASYVLRVNGADRPVTGAWIGESLLYVLRERLGLAGAKDGCSQGECGACNVQVDGRLVASCLVPAATAAGSEVRTVEGLATEGGPSDVQRALARCGAVQCGFCVPGMAMTVHDLLEGNPDPTDLEARQALSGNLCRCSGYRGVLDAVREVVAGREGAQDPGPAAEEDPPPAAEPARIPHQSGHGTGGTDPALHTSFTSFTPLASTDPTPRHEDDGGRA